MKYKFGKLIVISLGGSIVCPDDIDYKYLIKFKERILYWIKRDKKFVIIAGGGSVSRKYQYAAAKVADITNEDKDWIGIHATRLNAHLLRTIFRRVADPIVLDKKDKIKRLRKAVTIASGWSPGWSTDFVSSSIAKDFKAKEVIYAGRPAYVYTSDNQKDPGAIPIKKLSWKEYRRMIPSKWIPGSHVPVDPVSAQFSQENGIVAIVINGTKIENFDALLDGKEFEGTRIN